MNSIDTLIKTICTILDLQPLNGSYVDALGAYFNVIDQPDKAYNREVLVAALVNGVAPGTSEVLIFDTFADFPVTGDANSLYVAKDANVIYRWDDVLLLYAILNDPNVVNPDAPEEGATFYVRLATNVALNTNTYNNGTAGVGATLTSTANGVLSQSNQTGKIDNVTPIVGDIILIKNEASTIKNGIYEVTQVGSVSLPYILTRIDGYNETSEVYPSIVFVSAGSNNLNRYFTQNTANPVIGTNGLVFGVSAVSSPALPTMFMDTYLDDMTTLPGAYTYTNGTTFLTLPAYGANLRANANGALGTINGVVMTSGKKILINDPNFPLINGDFTVINAGSATQRWQLTRVNYSNSGFAPTIREWLIMNVLSTAYGSRFNIPATTLIDAQIGISQNINFNKQNNVGLRDVNGDLNLTDETGNSGLNLYGDGTTIIYGINSQLSLDLDTINRSAELTSDIVTISSNNGNVYTETNEALGRLLLEAGDGTDIESKITLTTQGAGEVKLYSTDGSNEASIGVTNAGDINLVSDNGIDLQTNNGPVSLTSFNDNVLINSLIVDITSTAGSIFLNANNGDIVLTASDTSKFIKIQGLDTYASDALAGAGGVPQNAVYKDATGLLRVKL